LEINALVDVQTSTTNNSCCISLGAMTTVVDDGDDFEPNSSIVLDCSCRCFYVMATTKWRSVLVKAEVQ
jgi:hypothetical protein